MRTIYYCDNNGVRAVASAKGFKQLKKQEKLMEKLYDQAGPRVTGIQASEIASRVWTKYPNPPIVTFALDHGREVQHGKYGHAGYRDLYELLVTNAGVYPVEARFTVPNSNGWTLEAPTEDTIVKVFGSLAKDTWRNR